MTCPVGCTIEQDPDDEAVARFARQGPVDLLLTAAAGCGKTEALAKRTAELIRDGHVRPHQRILAATFSNRARDNLSSRIRRQLTTREQGLVNVQNFHGIAWRIVRAHGSVIGLEVSELARPTKRDHKERQDRAGITWGNRADVEALIRAAKCRRQTDDEVLAEIQASGDRVALAYERLLRDDGRLDFDDLLRHAGRILQDRNVAFGYQQHFAAVIVDEVQDLSVTQLQMVQLLGGNRVTYSGDPGQGIYSFAGAEPEAVFADIEVRAVEKITLTRSFRSSPAVLAAVNALTELQDRPALRCADPTAWDETALLSTEAFTTLHNEAAFVADHVARLLIPGVTVGVLARTGPRLGVLRAALDGAGVPFTDWSAPLSDARVLMDLRRECTAAVATASQSKSDSVALLEQRCQDLRGESDLEGRDAVSDACAALRDLMDQHSIGLVAALARCRAAKPTDEPVGQGLHLLNAHLGKGQEFDHVVVAGLEEGILPDFRAVNDSQALAEELRTLTVMVSRARCSLLVTRSDDVPSSKGGSWMREPSRWWTVLQAAAGSRTRDGAQFGRTRAAAARVARSTTPESSGS